ncbi:MAG: MmcQ/YjbR family DNA-binding protein [Bacteroidaceae bacterium]|nr:MmcQ/YjbR family DNA-binding protein [Bacteroidales bacterium]MBP3670935.1 MmcQ/YjbR family DNA-binding protein [Bacteroidaceae bacterium]MBQ2979288.1 MmcQ/YjbR family DNA-binding protein [Bacteroidaceae bacterium]
MDIESLRDYCLSLPLATECFPFDDTTLVFKIAGRMFLFTSLDRTELMANVKCDPDYALELRDAYSEVVPGYHCNKKYWNSIFITPSLPDRLVREWVLHSYCEVVKKLNRKEREHIFELLDEWKKWNGI